jgi:hypothetical protein
VSTISIDINPMGLEPRDKPISTLSRIIRINIVANDQEGVEPKLDQATPSWLG